jgi:hypothetical protein
LLSRCHTAALGQIIWLQGSAAHRISFREAAVVWWAGSMRGAVSMIAIATTHHFAVVTPGREGNCAWPGVPDDEHGAASSQADGVADADADSALHRAWRSIDERLAPLLHAPPTSGLNGAYTEMH